MRIYSYLKRPPYQPTINDEPSMTQQRFANEVNINQMMKRYEETGILGDPTNPSLRQPLFGDFRHSSDLLEASLQLQEATEAFMDLPATTRERFQNNPMNLLAFVEDDKNRDEAIKLGFIEDQVTAPAPAPASAPAVP